MATTRMEEENTRFMQVPSQIDTQPEEQAIEHPKVGFWGRCPQIA
jgi:hypothetical protein